MAHYAILDDNNVVTQVITGKNEGGDIDWEVYYGELHNTICKRTSYNTIGGVHYTREETDINGIQNVTVSNDQTKSFRKNYAGIGYKYDENRDAFIPPKPFNSWILNETSCLWEAPVSYPTDGQQYEWNEDDQTWDLVS